MGKWDFAQNKDGKKQLQNFWVDAAVLRLAKILASLFPFLT